MATATKIDRPISNAWNTPGPAVVALELDANEVKAVQAALEQKNFTPHNAAARSAHSTSLVGGGARVLQALGELPACDCD